MQPPPQHTHTPAESNHKVVWSGGGETHESELCHQLETSVLPRAGIEQVYRELGAGACLNLKVAMVVLNANHFSSH